MASDCSLDVPNARKQLYVTSNKNGLKGALSAIADCETRKFNVY